MSYYSCNLNVLELSDFNQAIYSSHCLFIAAFCLSESIMCFFKSVNTYRNCIHSAFQQIHCTLIINKSTIACHAPIKSQTVCI